MRRGKGVKSGRDREALINCGTFRVAFNQRSSNLQSFINYQENAAEIAFSCRQKVENKQQRN